MIAVIDHGICNLRSVEKALAMVGADVRVTHSREDLRAADGIVMPGVGAFKPAMESLEGMGIIPTLLEQLESGKPYLGFCLGLQLLMEESEEYGSCKGLGVFKGKCPKLQTDLSVPHMGWNQVAYKQDHPYFKGIPENSYFYFDHSYYVLPDKLETIAGTTDYGSEIPVILSKGDIFATQFHPEKSQIVGLKMLENFVAHVKEVAK